MSHVVASGLATFGAGVKYGRSRGRAYWIAMLVWRFRVMIEDGLMEPTNLIIIMDDEHSKKVLGCYGNPLARTPNLDRLAAAGTLFERAYTNSPLCVPARAAFATGRYVHQIGYWDNAIAYDGRVRSWTHDLQETAHPVVSVGKLHYRNADDPTGFDRQVMPMHIADGRGDTHGLIREPLPPVRYQSKALAEEIGPGETPYIRYDRNITDEACRWLQHEGRAADKPWVLLVSFICPHYPLIAPPEFYALYRPEDMPLPKERRTDMAASHPWWHAFENAYIFERYFTSDRQRQVAIASYYALCSFIDANVEKILATLDAAALTGNTRVAFVSDHGENLGARRLWCKSTLYEESAGIPMLLAGPGVPCGRRCQTPVSLIDFYPTVLDAVGEKMRGAGELPGESLLGIVQRPDDTERLVLSEYHGAGSRSGAFMLRRGRYKYLHYVGFEPELYDLDADPEELDDLSGRREHAAVIAAFEKALRALLDPEAVDARAKADQLKLIERYGGREALLAKGGIHGTPVPGDAAQVYPAG